MSTQFSLQEVLDIIADGVRFDAFGGPATLEVSTPDTLIVVTVLTKGKGSLSCQGLTKGEIQALQKIVRPAGTVTHTLSAEQICEYESGDPLNFMVWDNFGRFIWLQKLIVPEGRNHQHLLCYHNNTFQSMVLALHQRGLLKAALGDKVNLKPAPFQLLENAAKRLRQPTYLNISLRKLLESSYIKDTLTEAAARWKI
jgi:hypothetical protein